MKQCIKKDYTLQETIDCYLAHLQNKDSSPHTIRHYRTTLLEFHKFLYSQQKAEPMLASVTLEELSSYLSYKKECGTCGRTRRNYIITFRSFWKFSVRWGYTENNPTLWLEDIRVEKKERIYLTISEMQRFLQAIDHPLIYTACATICLSGLRISELCNLKIKDINFSRGEIHVICGKGKKDRVIPINDELEQILTDYLRNYRDSESDYFFATNKTGKLSQQYLNEKIHSYAKKAGVNEQISAHCLRHSFASALVAKGASITSIQRLLGHTDLKTTNIYTHTCKKDLVQSINLLTNTQEKPCSLTSTPPPEKNVSLETTFSQLFSQVFLPDTRTLDPVNANKQQDALSKLCDAMITYLKVQGKS